MAWDIDGRYFEGCSCDALCPCTWSGLTAHATYDRCNALLAFHIDRGELDGVDVSGTSFALVVDTPPVMSEGGWRVGAFLDAAASDEQREKLGALLGGELGGPPAMLGPLIGEMMGVEVAPITFEEDGRRHRVRIGDGVELEVEDFVAPHQVQPVQLINVFHPAGSTLTAAPTTRASITAFGLEFGREGMSGFSAPFRWAG